MLFNSFIWLFLSMEGFCLVGCLLFQFHFLHCYTMPLFTEYLQTDKFYPIHTGNFRHKIYNTQQKRKCVRPLSKGEFLRGFVLSILRTQRVQMAYKLLIKSGYKTPYLAAFLQIVYVSENKEKLYYFNFWMLLTNDLATLINVLNNEIT